MVARRNGSGVKRPVGETAMMVTIYVLIAAFALFSLLPFLLVVAGSITPEPLILRNGYRLIPEDLSFQSYEMLLGGRKIYSAYKITLIVTIGGTALSLLVTAMMAYPLSIKSLHFTNKITFFVFFTMLFYGGLAPWYIVVTRLLHLQNNIWALILPYMVSPWFMFLMRNFFRSIPDSLQESARIDGANDLYILFKIILPLSKPAIATIGLFYALQYWNDWWLSMLLIDKPDLFPLQYILRAMISNILNVASSMNPNLHTIEVVPAYSMRMATVLVTIGPIILLYPFLQKYFVKGLTIGAIKG